MDALMEELIALTPIPKKWVWLILLGLGIAGDVLSSYFVFYVLYPSSQYTLGVYESISGPVKLLLLIGLVSFYFYAVPQPGEKLYRLYAIFREIDNMIRERVRDRFRMFIIYDILLRFATVAISRIPWEVYKLLAPERQWQALSPTATQFQYDPIGSTVEGPVQKLEAVISKIKCTEVLPLSPGNAKPPSDERVIRLLKLSKWYPGNGIHAKIIEAHLDNLPEYEAISYTWGDPTKTRIIFLDGSSFAVTSNVYNILEDRCSIRRPKLIWIDSICINQDDLQEKSQQVQLMRDIYCGAKQVTIWLGDAPDAHLASFLVYKICMVKYLYKWSVETMHDMYRRDGTRRTPPWLAFGDLINNPYWDRVWIIQEFASASKIEVVYGRRIIDWVILRIVMTVFTNAHMATLLCPTKNVSVQRKLPLDKLAHALALEWFQQNVQQKQPMSLTEVLRIANGFKATDPRDLLFALTGITDNPTDSLITPDYKKTVRDVFRDGASFILNRQGSKEPLFFLAYAGVGHPRLVKSLPSWVPDWTSPVQPLTGGLRCTNYLASGHTHPTFFQILNADVIVLGGLVVDEIRELSPHFPGPVNPAAPKISDIFKSTRQFQAGQDLVTKCLDGPYVNGQSLYEAFWRAAIGDASNDERPAPAEFGEYFNCYAEMFVQNSASTLETFAEVLEGGDDALDALDMTELVEKFGDWGSSEELLMKIANCTKFTAMANNVSVNRQLCITKKGYIGWVPSLAEVGDLVSIIDGEPTPYIVRKCAESTAHLSAITSPDMTRFLDSCWTPRNCHHADSDGSPSGKEASEFLLVGSCYIHAMMDGEMLDTGIPQPFIFR